MQEGQLVLNPRFVQYLEGKGIRSTTPFLFDNGSAALPEEIVAEGFCQCERMRCVDMANRVYCRWTKDQSNWVIKTRLYWRCYDELIVCSRCGMTHKRGHIGKRGSCNAPYANQEEHAD